MSLFSNSSSVQLSIISIQSYIHTNSRISWLFCIIHDVMTHKLLQLGQDVQNRRRAVGGSTAGVELSCVVCTPLRRNSTQLDVELSWVELCRYKRGFSLSFRKIGRKMWELWGSKFPFSHWKGTSLIQLTETWLLRKISTRVWKSRLLSKHKTVTSDFGTQNWKYCDEWRF